MDGQDISKLGLHTLRKNVAFIPQQPFLLQGSIRENVDPFNEKTEDDIKQVLREVNLYDHIMKMDDGLNTRVAESNNLFSVGQK